MEIRSNVRFFVLSIYQDKLAKICYIKILTENKVETIKLTSSNNSYLHQLEMRNIITGELIKTRKNWILKEIENVKSIFKLTQYIEYQNLATIQKTLDKLLIEGVETDIFNFLTRYFSIIDLTQVDLYEFEHLVLSQLGFARPFLDRISINSKNLSDAKIYNHLN